LGYRSWRGLHHQASFDELLHLYLGVPPEASHAHDLVLGIPLCCTAGPRHAYQPVHTLRVGLDILVEVFNVLLCIGLELRVELLAARLCVEQNRIGVVIEERRSLPEVPLHGFGSLPNDVIAKLFRAKDPVKQDLQVVTRGRVAVQVEATGVLEHAVQLK
jgi:hypothetical protein